MQNTILNIISTFGNRDILFLLLGIFIGILINRKTNIITMIIKNPVEATMLVFITLVVLSQFFSNGPINNENSFDILNFISNVALAWVMTKYSVKNDYEEKSKEMASISYSYSLKCEQSIDYGIKICGLAEKKLEVCECNNNNCKLNHYIHRVRDSILTAQNDIKQNTLNWSYKISDEISKVKKMNSLASEIKDLENKLQVLDPKCKEYNSNKYNLETSIKKKHKEINSLGNSINTDIRLAIENALINQKDTTQIINESISKEDRDSIIKSAKDKLKPRNSNDDSISNSSISV